MKIAISLPDKLFKAAENHASQRQISRSALIAEALEQYLDTHENEDVTKRLNEIYSKESNSIAPQIMRAQLAAIKKEDW